MWRAECTQVVRRPGNRSMAVRGRGTRNRAATGNMTSTVELGCGSQTISLPEVDLLFLRDCRWLVFLLDLHILDLDISEGDLAGLLLDLLTLVQPIVLVSVGVGLPLCICEGDCLVGLWQQH